jgi:hypothetical protein
MTISSLALSGEWHFLAMSLERARLQPCRIMAIQAKCHFVRSRIVRWRTILRSRETCFLPALRKSGFLNSANHPQANDSVPLGMTG